MSGAPTKSNPFDHPAAAYLPPFIRVPPSAPVPTHVFMAVRQSNGLFRNYLVRLDSISSFLEKSNRGEKDVYYVVNRVKSDAIKKYLEGNEDKPWVKTSGRAKNDEIAGAWVLFADIDYKDPDLDYEKAVEEIARVLPFDFTAVFSGRGIHVYVHLNEEAKIHKWVEVEKAFVEYLARAGLPVDRAVKDPARILRVVGTRNRKSGRIVDYVKIAEKTYSLKEIAEFLESKKALEVIRKKSEEEVKKEEEKLLAIEDGDLRPLVVDEFLKVFGSSEKWKGKRVYLDEISDAYEHKEIDISRSAIAYHLAIVTFAIYGKRPAHLQYLKRFLFEWIKDDPRRAEEILQKQVMHAWRKNPPLEWVPGSLEKLIIALVFSLVSEDNNVPISTAAVNAFHRLRGIARAFDTYALKVSVGSGKAPFKRLEAHRKFERALLAGLVSALNRLGVYAFDHKMKRQTRTVFVLGDGSVVAITHTGSIFKATKVESMELPRIISLDDGLNPATKTWKESRHVFRTYLTDVKRSMAEQWIKKSISNIVAGIVFFGKRFPLYGPGVVNDNEVYVHVDYARQLRSGSTPYIRAPIDIEGRVEKLEGFREPAANVTIVIKNFKDFYVGAYDDYGLLRAVSILFSVAPLPPIEWIEAMRDRMGDVYYDVKNDVLEINLTGREARAFLQALLQALMKRYPKGPLAQRYVEMYNAVALLPPVELIEVKREAEKEKEEKEEERERTEAPIVETESGADGGGKERVEEGSDPPAK